MIERPFSDVAASLFETAKQPRNLSSRRDRIDLDASIDERGRAAAEAAGGGSMKWCSSIYGSIHMLAHASGWCTPGSHRANQHE